MKLENHEGCERRHASRKVMRGSPPCFSIYTGLSVIFHRESQSPRASMHICILITFKIKTLFQVIFTPHQLLPPLSVTFPPSEKNCSQSTVQKSCFKVGPTISRRSPWTYTTIAGDPDLILRKGIGRFLLFCSFLWGYWSLWANCRFSTSFVTYLKGEES